MSWDLPVRICISDLENKVECTDLNLNLIVQAAVIMVCDAVSYAEAGC